MYKKMYRKFKNDFFFNRKIVELKSFEICVHNIYILYLNKLYHVIFYLIVKYSKCNYDTREKIKYTCGRQVGAENTIFSQVT